MDGTCWRGSIPIDWNRIFLEEVELDPPGRFEVPSILVNLMVKFRRRSMKYVATRTMRRRLMHAATMPPSSLLFIPFEGVEIYDVSEVGVLDVIAGNFAIGVGTGVVYSVDADGLYTVSITVVMVVTSELEFVDVRVSVRVTVSVEVVS